MGDLVILDECRCLEIRCNSVEGFISLSESLDGEKETISLSFEEAFKVFQLIVDTVNKRAAI